MKNLILTISMGDAYQDISVLTHNTIESYANKICADFKVIREQKISTTSPHWEKFQIFDLLNNYDRILFIDSDIIIRDDCPNLFDIVPRNKIGAFNEAPFTDRSKELLIDTCKEYDVKLSGWNGKYFNTGVLLVSRVHKFLFKKPEKEYCSFYEQTYLNMKLAEAINNNDIETFDLDYKFNRMTCLDRFCGEDRHASYIIHYAGCPNISLIKTLIVHDILKWRNDKDAGYKYRKHIHILVNGGLGDQVCAEPAIRFMIENIYKNDEVIVSSHWPRIFKHLPIEVYQHGKFQQKDDTPYYQVYSLPAPDSIQWFVVSNLLSHTVDYCSIALGKRLLPTMNKTIKLEFNKDDEHELNQVTKITDYSDYICVHPGRHWQSKTFPDSYWQKLIDLLAKDFKVIVIGKDEETRGTAKIICPKNVVDTRNLLDLGSLIALISKCKITLSNDSCPIHIAGAFYNWIVLLPSCKHPDHVLPYRHGTTRYKTLALYKKLSCDEFISDPTSICSTSAEFNKEPWENYLLDPEDIVEQLKKLGD